MSEVSVSVIMPVYNAEAYLRQAISSVEDQSLSDWELIVVDDGSTDRSATILDEFESSSIRVIRQENKGVSAARNAALNVARGRYVTFLDADDALPPNSLEARANYLDEHPEVDVVDGQISVRDERLCAEISRHIPYYRGPLLPRLLQLDSRVFLGVCYMFRRSAVGDIRFPEHMSHAEDLAFFMMLSHRRDLSYGFVEAEVYHCRSHGSSAMSNMAALEKGYLDLLGLIEAMAMASWLTRHGLRLRVAKILFLSWRARDDTLRGLQAAMRAMAG